MILNYLRRHLATYLAISSSVRWATGTRETPIVSSRARTRWGTFTERAGHSRVVMDEYTPAAGIWARDTDRLAGVLIAVLLEILYEIIIINCPLFI